MRTVMMILVMMLVGSVAMADAADDVIDQVNGCSPSVTCRGEGVRCEGHMSPVDMPMFYEDPAGRMVETVKHYDEVMGECVKVGAE